MPHAERKFLLTGGSSGIGLATARELAATPDCLVIVASRTAPPTPLPPNVRHLFLDLSSEESVRSFVAAWTLGPLDALVLNSGIFPMGAPKFDKNGIEMGVVVNHLFHALLFFLLKEKDLLLPECRIIIVTSAMHDPKAPGAPASPYWTSVDGVARAQDKEHQNHMIRYANSKLFNILFAYSLAKHIEKSEKQWTVVAFEPGFTPTGGSQLGRDAPASMKWMNAHITPHVLWIFRLLGTVVSTPPVSGKAMAKVILSDEYKSVTGKYVLLHDIKPSSKDSYDRGKQEELWNWTLDKVARDQEERQRFDSF